MKGPAQLPERASARARRDVAWLFLRALGQLLMLPARVLLEAFRARRRRAAMAALLRRTAETGDDISTHGVDERA